MHLIKLIAFILLFNLITDVQANSQLLSLEGSQQLIVVKKADPHSSNAQLFRYERADNKWEAVGRSISVIIGKKGMTKDKKEGDLASPIGTFSLGTAFGFAAKPDFLMKLSYLPITDSTVCVDDTHSKFYNQIIDSSKVDKTTWASGEQMREKIPQYTWGLVINYNLPNPKPGAGSCIFMHVWNPTKSGTAGCVAMSLENMKKILAWVDPSKKPLLMITAR